METTQNQGVVSRQLYFDRDLYRAFKAKAATEGKSVNQAANDLVAEHVGMPTRQISTGRLARSA